MLQTFDESQDRLTRCMLPTPGLTLTSYRTSGVCVRWSLEIIRIDDDRCSSLLIFPIPLIKTVTCKMHG